MTPAGFPHSEILGSQPARGSPRLIAACYVLHRRSAPRHPPFTLSSLTIRIPKTLGMPVTQLSCQRTFRPVGPRRSTPGATARTDGWWSRSDSNRRPPPCKGGALPTELLPLSSSRRLLLMVGLTGIEPVTSRLSGVRSNHLSYRPLQRTRRGSLKTKPSVRWSTSKWSPLMRAQRLR